MLRNVALVLAGALWQALVIALAVKYGERRTLIRLDREWEVSPPPLVPMIGVPTFAETPRDREDACNCGTFPTTRDRRCPVHGNRLA